MTSSAEPLSREARHAQCDWPRFAWLLVQLAAAWLVFRLFDLESGTFLQLFALTIGAFAVHYITPFRFKKPVFLLLSLGIGIITLAHPDPAARPSPARFVASAVFVLVILLGLAGTIFFVMRRSMSYRIRIGIVLCIGAGLAVLRAAPGGLAVMPDYFWTVLGAVFMFRTILYVHEVGIARKPESFADFLCYFFLPPNFYFTLFPVIDYATFKKSHYADDIHATAQRGIAWIVRGAVQFAVYRVIYHRVVIGPEDVHSLLSLARYVLPTYLLYMQVSGQFHVIIGLLHLFGYKLPETNRKYLLASSFTDFWRRINIYWKDFMIKVFYYPAYFRLRKKNETLAIAVATAWVFLATTVLHGYQWFWLQGDFRIKTHDVVFWCVLGVLVFVTVLGETRRKPGQKATPSLPQRIASTIGVYLFISVLWSMWYSGDVSAWWDTVCYWR